MTRGAALACSVVLTVGSLGCSNALFFYETEKISLTLEARPDSSQPVQGSFGGKARTVVVAPPRSRGEAGSMISSFRVRKEDGFLGAVTMQSALVTGAPATDLSPGEAGRVALTVSGADIPSTDELATRMRDNGLGSGSPQAFRDLIAKKCDDLTAEDIDTLGTLTGFGAAYAPVSDRCQYHNAVRKLFGLSEGDQP